MKRLLGLLVALSVMYWGIRGVGKTPATQEVTLTNTTVQEVQSPTPSPIGEPRRITIPTLSVDASIENVGMDPSGRMGVPSDADIVGWWMHGVRPGEAGSAVVAGHLDTPQGSPGVFYAISQLEPGDVVEITDSLGVARQFTVYKTEMHTDADFPLQDVFLNSDGRLLNLITCAGTFDAEAQNYDQRFVVYSKLNSD